MLHLSAGIIGLGGGKGKFMRSGSITIVNNATLALATEYIRDGEFSDRDLSFNESLQLVSLTLWKADDELASIEIGGFIRGWQISPMRRLVLIFTGVRDMHFVEESKGTEIHPLGGVQWNQHDNVRIDTYDGITINLTVNSLNGELQISDDIDQSRVQRTRSWVFWRRCCRRTN